MDYEIHEIQAMNTTQAAEYRQVESEWTVIVDGETKTAIERNRKTGEMRPYDYDKAVSEMLG